MEIIRNTESDFSQWCVERMRYNGQLKWEVLSGYKENLFHYQDSQPLKKVAQRICAFSIPGGFQDQAG